MKVYALWKDDGKYQYRWRTLLHFGDSDSWDIIGSVYMKNPGSATPIGEPDASVLAKLKEDFSSSIDGDWKEFDFSTDKTMQSIEQLFTECYGDLNGVIQIFNLFNLKNQKLEDALKIINRGEENPMYLYTFDEDISHFVYPVYIGWGDLWKKSVFNKKKVENAFVRAKALAGIHWHLADALDDPNNHYYHPKYLYVHPHKYDNDVTQEKQSFINMVK